MLVLIFKRKEEQHGEWGMLIKRESIRELVMLNDRVIRL